MYSRLFKFYSFTMVTTMVGKSGKDSFTQDSYINTVTAAKR